MRKLMFAVTLAVVLIPLLAAVALAAEGQLIQCRHVLPCTGSKGDDRVLERIGDGKQDEIVPLGGDDLVLANISTRRPTAQGLRPTPSCSTPQWASSTHGPKKAAVRASPAARMMISSTRSHA